MAQTREGAQKISAAHAGLSVMDYKGWRKRGYLWCTRCKGWHPKKSFGKDASRPDRNERATSCKESRHAYSKRIYIKKGRPAHSGPPPFPPRAGDKLQARQRINVLVRTGKLLHPRELPCFDCGHIWIAGQRRHEYDHYNGYDAEHHYDVQAVCTICHSRRANERGETNHTRGTKGRFTNG